MSFYTQDDDGDQDLNARVCANCSATNFYNDPTTGNLMCSECFTQHENYTQELLDHGEGLGLAAAKGAKRSLNAVKRGENDPKPPRKKKDLKEYDKSRRLPTVKECCLAYQWLLNDAAGRVARLSGIQKDHRHLFLKEVRAIWFTYLRTWMEAAEFYAAEYPEMRLSFRDLFVGHQGGRRSYLVRHLNVVVGRKVEEEIMNEIEKEYARRHGETSEDDASGHLPSKQLDADESSFDEEGTVSSSTSKASLQNRRHLPMLLVSQLYSLWPKPLRHPNGAYEMHPHHAALRIRPSLTLLLSILHLALQKFRTGVAPCFLIKWCANGMLPHGLNGYDLLPQNLKESVFLIQKFFKRSICPLGKAVADLSDFLAVICGYHCGVIRDVFSCSQSEYGGKSELQLNRTPSPSSLDNEDQQCTKQSPSTQKDNNENSTRKKIDYKSNINAPLMAARLVQEFGMGQTVLNNALALMGVIDHSSFDHGCNEDANLSKDSNSLDGNHRSIVHETDHNEELPIRSTNDDSSSNEDNNICKNTNIPKRSVNLLSSTVSNNPSKISLPPALRCASPDNLYTQLHVAAVIVVACKLCRGWESWKFSSLHYHSGSSDMYVGNNGAGGGSSPAVKPGTSTCASKNDRAPFIPWDESQFALIRNGPSLNHYLDFMERVAFPGLKKHQEMTHFLNSLNSLTNDHKTNISYSNENDTDKMDNVGKIPSWKKVTRTSQSLTMTLPTSFQNDSPPHVQQTTHNIEHVVTPNVILSGAPNPNEPLLPKTSSGLIATPSSTTFVSSQTMKYLRSNGIGTYISYQKRFLRYRQVLTVEPYHPHYCRLLEFICFHLGENSHCYKSGHWGGGSCPAMLHSYVEELEKELLSPLSFPDKNKFATFDTAVVSTDSKSNLNDHMRSWRKRKMDQRKIDNTTKLTDVGHFNITFRKKAHRKGIGWTLKKKHHQSLDWPIYSNVKQDDYLL